MPELTDGKSLQERIREESRKYLTLPPGDNEFTTDDYIRWNDIVDRNAAYSALREMVKDGTLYKRKGKLNGASVNVYGFKVRE